MQWCASEQPQAMHWSFLVEWNSRKTTSEGKAMGFAPLMKTINTGALGIEPGTSRLGASWSTTLAINSATYSYGECPGIAPFKYFKYLFSKKYKTSRVGHSMIITRDTFWPRCKDQRWRMANTAQPWVSGCELKRDTWCVASGVEMYDLLGLRFLTHAVAGVAWRTIVKVVLK